MEFPLHHSFFSDQSFILSDSWRQIFQNNGDAIPDTLRRSIRDKCINIEEVYRPIWDLWVSGEEFELLKKYEVLGMKVLSSKGTPDWKNVEENLQRMNDEYEYVSIRVKTLTGNVRNFNDISRFCSVREFRNEVSAVMGIPADEFMLVHNETELLDEALLCTYDIIKNKATVNVLPRRGNGLFESVRYMFKQACDVTTNLGKGLAHDDGEPKRKHDRLKLAVTIRKGIERLAQDEWEPKRKIQIKLKTVEGLEHVFKELSTDDLILDFKRKIALQIGGMVEDEIILLCGDKELRDNDTLDTYGITNGETVFMLQRLRGKGLMETARYLYNEARNVLKYLGECVPGLFADSTRALTTKELSKVAQEIGMNWELLGPVLGLDSVQMDHITEDNPSSTVKKIYTMLTTWLNVNQGEATVGKLYQAMNDCKKVRFNWTKIKNIFSGVDAVFICG